MSGNNPKTAATSTPAAVDLWLFDPSQASTPEQAAPWAGYLDADERARCRELRTATARARFVLGHGLVRTALSEFSGVAPGDWRFVRSDKGRPEISAPMDVSPLAFSLSYTDRLIVCAVTRVGPIGVDVEHVSEEFPYTDIESRVLSPGERDSMNRLPAAERRDRFYALWTLKEAYLKALGVGFELEPGTLEFGLDTAGNIDANLGGDTPWQFELLEPAPRYRAAIACGPGRPFLVHSHRVAAPGADSQRVTCRSIARSRPVAP